MKKQFLFLSLIISATSFAQTEADFETVNVNGGLKITNYKGTEKNITIPDTIGGERVISLGEKAFFSKGLTGVVWYGSSIDTIGAHSFQWNNFEQVVIPEGVKYIADYAFAAGELKNVTIPYSVSFIGESAFQQNHILSISLPANLTTIEPFAFKDNQLSTIVIPSKVTTIGEYAFCGNLLTSITMPENIIFIGKTAFNGNKITSINGKASNGIFFKRNQDASLDSSVIVSYGGTAKVIDFIPATVKTIADYAFDHDSLTSVIIPNGVKEIENRAFSSNVLEYVEIPATVDSIGEEAFVYNNPLANISILNEDTIIIHKGAFLGTKMSDSSSVIWVVSEAAKTKYENSNWAKFGATIKVKPVIITSAKSSFSEVKTYPNPVKDILTIESPVFQNLKVVDLNGKVVFQKVFEKTVQIDMSSYNKGIYIIKLQSGDKTQMTKIVVK